MYSPGQLASSFPLFLQRYPTSNIFPVLPPVFLNPSPQPVSVQPVLSLSILNGQTSQIHPIELTLTQDDAALSDLLSKRDHCENLSLLYFSIGNNYFHNVICTALQGLKDGDSIELTDTWRSLCKSSKSKDANVQNNKVVKTIHFGEEIILEEQANVEISADLHSNSGRLTQFSESGCKSNGYQCERCGKVFTYEYYKEKHLKYTRCVDQGDRKYRCALCPRSFEKRDRLRIHVLHVHENHRPHVCTICDKSFSQSSSLNKHLRVHSGERPYKCEVCGKSFTASSILRTHIRQHSGEKPFQCSICSKSFASHAAHDSHVRRTHSLQDTHRFKCSVCDKAFEHKSHLNFHEQCVHSNNK